MYGLCLVVITVCVLVRLWRAFKEPEINLLPGPRGLPIVGIGPILKPATQTHLIVSDWARKYGPVFSFRTLASPYVVVSDFDSIYEVTMKKGNIFGGRSMNYRTELCSHKTGVLWSKDTDDVWRSLRQSSQKHLSQFGNGISEMEGIFTEVAENMFDSFRAHCGHGFDPRLVILETVLYTIVLLITGQRAGRVSSIVDRLRRYEEKRLEFCSSYNSFSSSILDCTRQWPCFNIYFLSKIKQLTQIEAEIWEDIKKVTVSEREGSLCHILLRHAQDVSKRDFTETDVKKTVLATLSAGVTTTANNFYALINLLAHRPYIQDKLYRELESVCSDNEATLNDRPHMPYTRACLFELLRYISILPLSVPHRAICTDTIQGYTIPKDTTILINLWHLHHDPNFWDQPMRFNPERFLAADGSVLPADNPKRKRLMAFGAGPRVCLGETTTQTRLFLWLTALVRRFTMEPAEHNYIETSDPTHFTFQDILVPCSYEVIFRKRTLQER